MPKNILGVVTLLLLAGAAGAKEKEKTEAPIPPLREIRELEAQLVAIWEVDRLRLTAQQVAALVKVEEDAAAENRDFRKEMELLCQEAIGQAGRLLKENIRDESFAQAAADAAGVADQRLTKLCERHLIRMRDFGEEGKLILTTDQRSLLERLERVRRDENDALRKTFVFDATVRLHQDEGWDANEWKKAAILATLNGHFSAQLPLVGAWLAAPHMVYALRLRAPRNHGAGAAAGGVVTADSPAEKHLQYAADIRQQMNMAILLGKLKLSREQAAAVLKPIRTFYRSTLTVATEEADAKFHRTRSELWMPYRRALLAAIHRGESAPLPVILNTELMQFQAKAMGMLKKRPPPLTTGGLTEADAATEISHILTNTQQAVLADWKPPLPAFTMARKRVYESPYAPAEARVQLLEKIKKIPALRWQQSRDQVLDFVVHGSDGCTNTHDTLQYADMVDKLGDMADRARLMNREDFEKGKAELAKTLDFLAFKPLPGEKNSAKVAVKTTNKPDELLDARAKLNRKIQAAMIDPLMIPVLECYIVSAGKAKAGGYGKAKAPGDEPAVPAP